MISGQVDGMVLNNETSRLFIRRDLISYLNKEQTINICKFYIAKNNSQINVLQCTA